MLFSERITILIPIVSCVSVTSSPKSTSILFTLELNSEPALNRMVFFFTFNTKSEWVHPLSITFSMTFSFCLGLFAQGGQTINTSFIKLKLQVPLLLIFEEIESENSKSNSSHIPCALKDSTGTHTTKLRLNFWLSEPRHESEFQKF